MKTILLLCLIPALALCHWRCQDGSKANCDQACADEADPEIPNTEVPEEGETTTVIASPEFDISIEAEKYNYSKNFLFSRCFILRFRMFNPCSSSQQFDKALCTCSDGSNPTSTRIKAVCSDNSRPDCSGSCPDGSDPTKLPKFLLM